MLLEKILAFLELPVVHGDVKREVETIVYDSRMAKPGAIFVAMKGEHVDGHDFIEQAINNGAEVVVSQRPYKHPKATLVIVPDSRVAMGELARGLYGYPSGHLKVTGITGTNGKTTTSFLLKHICETALLRTGLIGTVRYEIGDRLLPSIHTTPESADIQHLLYQIRAAGCKGAIMEVSSHAIKQKRTQGVEFDVAVFTNLTQDHLDYHRTMESYFEVKAQMFRDLSKQKKKAVAVVNGDDTYGSILSKDLVPSVKVLTYGQGRGMDFRGSDYICTLQGARFKLEAGGRSFLVRLPLIGKFNLYNALAAIAAASVLGIDIRTAVQALKTAPQAPGRLQMVPGKRNFQVFVDYAHTPDALENVLRTLKELATARVITVFGCGGDRDRQKRPLMAASVEKYSDHIILTSDNPRNEDQEQIFNDTKKGFVRASYECIPDRKEAIDYAVNMANEKDIILIAGKGHETYQEIEGQKFPFDDVEVAAAAIREKVVEN